MITEKPEYKSKADFTPAVQFVIFCAVAIGLITAGNVIAMGIIFMLYGLDALKLIMAMNLTSPQAIQSLWLLQIVGTTLPILFTPIVFSKFIVRNTSAYLLAGTRFPLALLAIVFSLMIMSSPVMEVLINLNQKMVLPDFLKAIEDWMRSSEEAAQKATEALLKMNTWLDMVKCLLLVGLVTAIAEELMFRGTLQTIFIRWTNNPHLAIWITATLFSAFHIEFFGFLPRLMLGVFFGYFAYWSGSVWPAVWAHFLNNGSAVVLTYLYQHKKLNIDPNNQHAFNYSLYALSLIITVALLLIYRKTALERNNLSAH
ncbi:CPBP family intramembrane glutamic endopeptidase [Mucilaginibacter sp. PAMB04274]|uniref:CPBP family intramembrane glutamic endopeptidase n=1 Tax=Mucilaginibacter sp. PAMB04274 TaxID=3138568 RepID=UPI0031F70CF3